jgi:putative Mg2+ transporter-C (MgtC) family protein
MMPFQRGFPVIESSQINLSMPTPQHIYEMLQTEMNSMVGVSMVRLVVAAILGGLIGLERELKHRPSGLRTNLFICLGAAMYTILSDALAVEHIGDHTRIAAQIIPGIGFIGAGTIIHAGRDLVTGITSAATLFVVASVGMAVGGGFYLTASFATGLILICLYLLGYAEDQLSLKLSVHTYEVTGPSAEDVTAEVNRVLESVRAITQNAQVAPTKEHVRYQFDVEGTHRELQQVLLGLKQSAVLGSAVLVGRVQG